MSVDLKDATAAQLENNRGTMELGLKMAVWAAGLPGDNAKLMENDHTLIRALFDALIDRADKLEAAEQALAVNERNAA